MILESLFLVVLILWAYMTPERASITLSNTLSVKLYLLHPVKISPGNQNSSFPVDQKVKKNRLC